MPALDRVTLTDDDGAEVRLRELWAQRPAALVFLRHYGWLHCRAQAVQLHDLRHQPMRMPEQDWHQLGGTFVIAPGRGRGRVVFEHRAGHPGDEPDVDEIVRALGDSSA